MINNQRVLIVCSGNSTAIAPFIAEQVDALKREGVEIDIFKIKGKGFLGYLLNFLPLIRKIRHFKPEIVHAHYGLSGLLAGLQRRVPVIVTLHGSDVYFRKNKIYSSLAMLFSSHTIFVSRQMAEKINAKKNFSVIPCGISLHETYPVNKQEARNKLGFNNSKKYVLFSSSFNRKEKNSKLAKQAVNLLDSNIELIELQGFTRAEITLLYNAADVALLTSTSEGSPQFIKEAMACNIPIVSTDVGDVKENINGIDCCFVCKQDASDIAEKLALVLSIDKRTKGRDRIHELGLDSESIAQKIVSIYKRVAKK